MAPPLPRTALARVVLAAALFGAAAPLAKPLVDVLGPLASAGLLYLGAALVTLPAALRDRKLLRLRGRPLLRVVGAVAAGGLIAPLLLMLALGRAEAASVSLWLALETPFTALLAWLVFREPLARSTWLANGATVIAAGLLALPLGHAGPAALLVAFACLGWALDNNLTASIGEISAPQLTCIKGLAAAALYLSLAVATGSARLPTTPVLEALLLGTLGYGLSLVLYIGGARQLGAARAQLLFATAPLFGTALAWGLLGEQVELRQVAALGLLSAAVASLVRERHAHFHSHPATEHTHEHRHDDGHHGHLHPGLPPQTSHTHAHQHGELTHAHPHTPDLHHRHRHH